MDSWRPSPPSEIWLPDRWGMDRSGRQPVHLDPLLRRTGRVRSEGCRVLRFPGSEDDDTESGAVDRKGGELVRDRGDQGRPRRIVGLRVADHLRQEVYEIGGLDDRSAVLTVPERRKGCVAGDADVATARRTSVVRRDSGLSYLLDEIVHVHVDLRHDLAAAVSADFARFLPQAERLVDACRRFVVFRLDQVSRLLEELAASVVLGHRDGPSRSPGVESDSAEDVGLADHGGRMPAGDERPGPPIEAFPRAHWMVRREGPGSPARERTARAPAEGRVGIDPA